MWSLLAVAVLAAGFALRLNPLLTVTLAAATAGLAGGVDPLRLLDAFGKAFNDSRYVSAVWLVLPVIGLLERAGLQQRARQLVARAGARSAGALLGVYFVIRQGTAALGLTSLGGHAQMVRPLVAPMAEAAAETRLGPLSAARRALVRAHAAAADNVALFFGEDIFLAIASILLIKGFYEQNGIVLTPLQLAVWAMPTALAALLVHGLRLARLDGRIARAPA